MDGGVEDQSWIAGEGEVVLEHAVEIEPPEDPVDIVPSGPSRRNRRRGILAGVAVIAVLAAVGSGIFVVNGRKPAKWDPEIVPLATFVEHTRGGRFEKAVPIVFESDKVYKKHFAADDEAPDKAELADQLGELRALGVAAGALDLVKWGETRGAEGTAGFYSTEDRHIHVKGDRKDLKTVALRTTLVHELTH